MQAEIADQADLEEIGTEGDQVVEEETATADLQAEKEGKITGHPEQVVETPAERDQEATGPDNK